ncbi:hypothetical protein LAZ67_3005835 [Cordylochernes scorpioides]|uniref:Transposase n=1 Tax=Cordylochernes scorpioides TaxID=51811 RepID=A0ABY6KFD2_9ARAC|nr:hypothetical protein LAZ67_3005835 [Cordylochernes scorpioides]
MLFSDIQRNGWTVAQLRNTSQAQIAPKEDYAGLIHHSLLNPGETITLVKYCQQIDEMHQKLRFFYPGLVNIKGLILLHDNDRHHVSMILQKELNELGHETLDHLPYSPDISPTNYHFFRHLTNFLGKKCLRNRGDAKKALNDFIASITPEFYRNGINQLVSHWQECIDSNWLLFLFSSLVLHF